MILDEQEIRELTRCKRTDAQRRELDHLGVAYRVRRDGTLLVLWADVAPTTARSNIFDREPQMHL